MGKSKDKKFNKANGKKSPPTTGLGHDAVSKAAAVAATKTTPPPAEYVVGRFREETIDYKRVQVTTVSVHSAFVVERVLRFNWDGVPMFDSLMLRLLPQSSGLQSFLRQHSEIREFHRSNDTLVEVSKLIDELDGFEGADESEREAEQVAEFIAFLQGQIQETRDIYQRMVEMGKISYDLLSMHFKKGVKIAFGGSGDDELEGAVVTDTEYGFGFAGPYFAVKMVRYTSNGKYFGKSFESVSISGFRGDAVLSDLPVHVATEDELTKLSRRGQVWQAHVHAPQYLSYTGKIEVKAGWNSVQMTANGRCMIDLAMHEQMVDQDRWDRTSFESEEDLEEVPGDYLFTTPGYVKGFSMSKKKWGTFRYSGLSPIAFRDDAYDLLVLDPDVKAEVRSLVEQSEDMFSDIISGKGGGAIFLLHGTPGLGKAQPLSSMIKTPFGQARMGDIRVGDLIVGDDGRPHHVLGVYPQGVRPVYELTFEDGRVVRADEDHLWKVKRKGTSRAHRETGWDIQSTKRIVAQMGSNRSPHHVPLCQPVEYPVADLGIDPWLLGFLIGDGFMKDKHLSFSTADQEIVDRVSRLMPDGYDLHKIPNAKYDYRIRMTDRPGNSTHEIKDILKQYGLYGSGAADKFIPHICFRMSVDQRMELIRGLMDSDGFVGKTKAVQFTTISEQLILGFQQLIWSVGGICKITSRIPTYTNASGNVVDGQLAFTATVRHPDPTSLVWLSRKRDRLVDHHQYSGGLALRITSITQVDAEPTQCILIDSSSHLYLTDNFVVTHNTLTAESVAEILHRPLYSISVGELGVTPKEVEETLQEVLEMVTAWNAVLLLDEADIFLEARSKDDIVRNAMVGVFLRLLEYHNGVLFLTTNRVADFDTAVLSRISVILKYPDFTDDIRHTVWTNILSAAGLDGIKIDLPYMAATYPVNGRQIKNAIRISLSLAASMGVPVTQELIEGRLGRMLSVVGDLSGPAPVVPVSVPIQKAATRA